MQGIATTIRLVDQMTAPLMSINNAINNLTAGFSGVETAANIDSSSLASMQHQVEMLSFAAEQSNQVLGLVGDTIDEMAQGQDSFNNSVRQGHGAADGLMKKVMGVVAAYASIQGIRTVLGFCARSKKSAMRRSRSLSGVGAPLEEYSSISISTFRLPSPKVIEKAPRSSS